MEENFNLNIDYVNNNLEEIFEIFQRRNLYVHNGGLVNATYISKVNKNLIKDISIGEKLSINLEYLKKSINLLKYSGLLIGIFIWRKMSKNPQMDRPGLLINDIGLELMYKEEWEFGAIYFEFIAQDETIDNASKLICKINYWICVKKMDRFDLIKDEINKTDFSDKQLKYQFCLEVLKDNHDEAFEILAKAYPEEITDDSFDTWPIFTFVENDERILKYKEKVDISEQLQLDRDEIEMFNKAGQIDSKSDIIKTANSMEKK